jgi:hypothetical protein
MLKIVITLLLFMLELHAVNKNDLMGNWQAVTRTLNNGTETIEKEYLSLNANHRFELVILVSLQKDDAFIKDLRIEVTGTWESRDNMLVYVIKTVNVPVAKEVYRISQKSLENLAANFKYKFENDNIHMSKIKYVDGANLTIIGEKLRETKYQRQ